MIQKYRFGKERYVKQINDIWEWQKIMAEFSGKRSFKKGFTTREERGGIQWLFQIIEFGFHEIKFSPKMLLPTVFILLTIHISVFLGHICTYIYHELEWNMVKGPVRKCFRIKMLDECWMVAMEYLNITLRQVLDIIGT